MEDNITQFNMGDLREPAPRILMTLNKHDKPKLEKALESHPELHDKAYVMGNALYVNGQGPDLSALFSTWRNLPKELRP